MNNLEQYRQILKNAYFICNRYNFSLKKSIYFVSVNFTNTGYCVGKQYADDVQIWLQSALKPWNTIEDYVYHHGGIILNDEQMREYQLQWLDRLIQQLDIWILEDMGDYNGHV